MLLARGATPEARGLLEASLATRAAALSPHSPLLADSQTALAECLVKLGEQAQGRTLFDAAAEIQAFNVELGDQYRRPFLSLKAHLAANNTGRRDR